MKNLLLSGLLALSLLPGCDPDDDPPPPPAANEPRDGSQWVYKNTTYNEAGAVLTTANITLKATAVTIGGTTWLNMVDQATLQPVIAIQKRAEGWWYISYPTPTPSLWFKYPATVNETYAYVFGTCKVLSITESVTVPAGNYTNCYLVQGDDSNSKEDEFWFSPTGPIMVKFQTYDERTGGPASNVYLKQALELVSFTP